ncbi:MAG: COP23 domain-containing protein [Microcystaceae cyanobacterium]
MLKLTTRLEIAALGLTVTLLGIQIQAAIAVPINGYKNPQPVDIIINDDPQTAPPTRTSPNNNPVRTSSIDPRFTCQSYLGKYTVMYRPLSQPGQAYPWAIPQTLGNGWDNQKRCAEISQRLESYRPDGLEELQTGYLNGYQTICATTQAVPGCRIVLTVPPGQSAEMIRDRVFQSLTVADSGQMTQGVSAYQGGNSGNVLNQLGQLFGGQAKPQVQKKSAGINLRPFLDPQDGGTGQELSEIPDLPTTPSKAIAAPRNQTPSKSQRLNPNLFR